MNRLLVWLEDWMFYAGGPLLAGLMRLKGYRRWRFDFAQFRAERALKRARRTLAEVERESIADGRDRDWHA